MQIGQNHGHLFVKNNKNNRMQDLMYTVFVNYVKNLPMKKVVQFHSNVQFIQENFI